MSQALPLPAECCPSPPCPSSACGNPIDISSLISGLVDTVFDIFNVKSYGATGNGITDDSAAILAAIAAASDGGVIFFPDGDYLVTYRDATAWSVLLPYKSDQIFVGSGKARILVGNYHNDHGTIFGADLASLPINNVQFHNLRMLGQDQNVPVNGGQAISMFTDQDDPANSITEVKIHNCEFINFGSAVYIQQRTTLGSATRQVKTVSISDCYANGCIGSFATVDGQDIEVSNCVAYGYPADPTIAYDAVSCHSGLDIVISNNRFYDYRLGQVINIRNNVNSMCGSKNVLVDGNIIKNCASIQVSLQAGEPIYGVQDVNICNNIIDNLNVGVYITCAFGNAPFQHFNVVDNVINAISGIGVACNTPVPALHVTITGNTVITSSPGFGIHLQSVVLGTVSSNYVYCSSAIAADRVMDALDVEFVSFKSNHCYGVFNASPTIVFQHARECSIDNNYFYNKWLIEGSCHLSARGNSTRSDGAVKGVTIYRDPWEINDDIATLGVIAIPTVGTWKNGSVAKNVIAAVSGQPMGWVCTLDGTLGVLVGVTGDSTLNSLIVTMSDASGLLVGQYITIAGVTGVKQITTIINNDVYVDSVCDATVVGGAVAWNTPTFVAMANYA